MREMVPALPMQPCAPFLIAAIWRRGAENRQLGFALPAWEKHTAAKTFCSRQNAAWERSALWRLSELCMPFVNPTHVGMDRTPTTEKPRPKRKPHACGGEPYKQAAGKTAKSQAPCMWG